MAAMVPGRWPAIRFLFYLLFFVIAVLFVWFLAGMSNGDDTSTTHQLAIDINQGIVKIQHVDNHKTSSPAVIQMPEAPISKSLAVGMESVQETQKTTSQHAQTMDRAPPQQRSPKSSVVDSMVELIDHEKPFIISYCKGDWAEKAIKELARRIPLPNVQALEDPPDANIGFRSAWGRCTHQASAKLNIFIDMEAHDHSGRNPIISTVRQEPGGQGKYHIWVPYLFFHFPQRTCCKPEDLVIPKVFDKTKKKEVLESKTKFTAFAARYCDYKQGELVRTKFFDRLSKDYETADALSGCRRNTRPPKEVPEEYQNDRDKPIAWFKPYKFAIVFENTDKRGYCTEKLVNAALAATVPIYWGPPDIAEIVNMDAIVHCDPEDDFSFKSCIEEIRILDNDDEQYLEKLSQPLFNNNTLPDFMRWEPLVERIMEFYTEKVIHKPT